MKHKLSITLNEETLLQMREKIRTDTFRNKSHLIEYSVKKMMAKNE